jgi:hypothetical protein
MRSVISELEHVVRQAQFPHIDTLGVTSNVDYNQQITVCSEQHDCVLFRALWIWHP